MQVVIIVVLIASLAWLEVSAQVTIKPAWETQVIFHLSKLIRLSAIASDSRTVLVVDALGEIHVLNAKTGEIITRWYPYHEPLAAMDVSRTNDFAAVTTGSGIGIFSTSDGGLLYEYPIAGAGNLSISPDNTMLAAQTGNGTNILDIETGNVLRVVPGGPCPPMFINNDLLLSCYPLRVQGDVWAIARIVNIRTGAINDDLDFGARYVTTCHVSRNGRYVLVNYLKRSATDPQTIIYDALLSKIVWSHVPADTTELAAGFALTSSGNHVIMSNRKTGLEPSTTTTIVHWPTNRIVGGPSKYPGSDALLTADSSFFVQAGFQHVAANGWSVDWTSTHVEIDFNSEKPRVSLTSENSIHVQGVNDSIDRLNWAIVDVTGRCILDGYATRSSTDFMIEPSSMPARGVYFLKCWWTKEIVGSWPILF